MHSSPRAIFRGLLDSGGYMKGLRTFHIARYSAARKDGAGFEYALSSEPGERWTSLKNFVLKRRALPGRGVTDNPKQVNFQEKCCPWRRNLMSSFATLYLVQSMSSLTGQDKSTEGHRQTVSTSP